MTKEEDLREALEDMVNQFGYKGVRNGRRMYFNGGLSALEYAFKVLDWENPHDVHDETIGCDAPDCEEFVTCGFPEEHGNKDKRYGHACSREHEDQVIAMWKE